MGRVQRIGRLIATSAAVGICAIAGGGRVARGGGDDAPGGSVPLPLTGKVTVRAQGKIYVIDGPQVIPGGSEIRMEGNVRVQGINNASLDVRGGLSIHGTKDCWVRIENVDFSPTTKPDKMIHIDMCTMHGCKFKHAETASFTGGITIENSCLQYDCVFDVALSTGFLRIMTTEFCCPCRVSALPSKTKAAEFAIRTSWMKDLTFSGPAAATVRHSEVQGALEVRDVTDFQLDGTDLFSTVKFSQGADFTYAGVGLSKCNLLGNNQLVLARPAGKPERVKVDKWFFDGLEGPVTSEKAAEGQVTDGNDDPRELVKAIIVTPNNRQHVFLSKSLRSRAPPRGG